MMRMNFENLEVRQMIADRHIYYYELADRIGISNYTLSVWMRHPLTPDRKGRVLKALKSFDK